MTDCAPHRTAGQAFTQVHQTAWRPCTLHKAWCLPEHLPCACSALKEVRIPAGPRLVLLHHVDRWRNVLKPNIPLPGPPPGLYPNRPPPPEQKPSGRR